MASRLALRGVLVALVASLASGCSPTSSRMGVAPPPGWLIHAYKAPMGARPGPRGVILREENMKVGRASAANFVFPLSRAAAVLPYDGNSVSVGWGNVSLEKAMENGNLTSVAWSDYKELSILRIYTRVEIIAYGS